jgi:hypothetical protein
MCRRRGARAPSGVSAIVDERAPTSRRPIAPMTITAPARRSRAARGRWRVSDIAAYAHTAELPRFSILVALR